LKRFFVLGIIFFAGAGTLWGQDLYYSANAFYATGSYIFQENTRSFSFSNNITLQRNRFKTTFALPYVTQNTPWVSYNSTGYVPTGGPQHGTVGHSTRRGHGSGMNRRNDPIGLVDTISNEQSGFGDPTLSAGINLLKNRSLNTDIELNATLKFPLADPTHGFGTGGWDWSIGTAVSHRIDQWFFMGNASYWSFEDMPDLELNSSLSYSLGIGNSFNGGKWMVMGSISGMTQIIDAVDPPLSAGLGLGHRISSRFNTNLQTAIGLSESSADFSLGVGVQWKLW